jgi:hypothetical protein
MKHRIEYAEDGPLKLVRVHRTFYGRAQSKEEEPFLVEVDYQEDEPLWVGLVPEDEGRLGRSARADRKPEILVTPDPSLYGTESDRLAAKKLPLVEVQFGVWLGLNYPEL